MANIECPECGGITLSENEKCRHCGTMIESTGIHSLGSNQGTQGAQRTILIAGTVFLALGIIGIVLGAWWGAALIFPGVVGFFLGRMWS